MIDLKRTNPLSQLQKNHFESVHCDTSVALTASDTVKKDKRVTWKSPRGEKNELLREVLAGLVVALATIPTSISYSTVIGVNPITGIWNSAIVGLLVTIIGGGPGGYFLNCSVIYR